ncbi:hypothetical protein L1987_56567 [Smallanthus sonchifolius]|uniref:Uncharacterized protein n=1 Tax=Smallanthus sonchifolius TaxID=185202 RepID=A0ACB9ECQ9_9ASTR|nr:hypothetical protein L1987_56567 [Smallanthus sonchifolius]
MTGETGSYRYMAPHVFKHRKYAQKVDVFSFAMILYQMLEETRLYQIMNLMKQQSAQLKGSSLFLNQKVIVLSRETNEASEKVASYELVPTIGLSAGLLRQATYTTARLGFWKNKALEANDGKPLPLYHFLYI